MARRPPARVRAGLARAPRPYDTAPRRVVPGLSAPARRQVADFERTGPGPGSVALAVARWAAWVHGRRVHEPGPPDDLPCCDTGAERVLLQRALHALPGRAVRELRAVLAPLDAEYLARLRPDPRHNGRERWWTEVLP
ncbi:hypothetical protein [Kitasatospora paranensis]|uniref:Uncharacterized protein n=1 Tax=Kitasatospora paranensis TaxID=258053 RepID=A0ABW2FSE5_9ACTN